MRNIGKEKNIARGTCTIIWLTWKPYPSLATINVDKRLDKSEIYLEVGYINVWMLDRRLADKPTVTIY